MARALIVGCGCHGRQLGKLLLAKNWIVRGTSRREEGLAAIEAAGIESAIADPSRPDTVLDLVSDVTVLLWLLGSAEGTPEELSAIHGPRLERLLEKLVETPVRNFVYEAAGSVDPILLAHGNEVVQAASERWQIPFGSVHVDPNDADTWNNPGLVWLEAMANVTLDSTS